MSYPSIAIANYFIGKSFQTGIELTPMKLLKIVYIAHGWYLALKEEALIDEVIEAWQYGPVISSLYHVFKKYGAASITKQEYLLCNGQIIIPTIDEPNIKNFLDDVWEKYGKFTGIQLSTLSHLPNSPWDRIVNSKKSNDEYKPIPNDIIQEYYKKVFDEQKRKSL